MKRPPISVAKKRSRSSTFERTMRLTVCERASRRDLEHLYLGRAGEVFVAAQLLRRGLNAALASVDSGVDILAHQEISSTESLQGVQLVYQFQVKTTASREYRAALPVRKVHELWHKAINLIVVFWPRNGLPVAVVIPPSVLRMLTTGGFDDPRAPLSLRDGQVSLRVFSRGDKYFMRNKSNPLTPMLNRYDLVEPVGTDTGLFPYYASWGGNGQVVSLNPNPEK